MPSKSANVKNEKVREARGQGHVEGAGREDRDSPKASKHGGEKSHSGSGRSNQGGTTAQHQAACRKGGKAAASSSRSKK